MEDIDSTRARNSLIYIISGLKEWTKNWKNIPNNLHKGHLLLIQLALQEGVLPPGNLYDLFIWLQKPFRDWGINAYLELFDPDCSLLSKYQGLTEEAEDFLEEQVSVEESEQRVMRQILIYCREKMSASTKEIKENYDEFYRTIRGFVSKPQNAVLPSGEVYDFASSFEEPELFNLVLVLYEEVPRPYDQFAACPNCGWTMKRDHGNYRCTHRTCHNKAELSNLTFMKNQSSDKLLRLTKGIQYFVLVPGMTEQSIYERIRKEGLKAELYPEVDQYDIRVFTASGHLDFDVKEYYAPNRLADYLNQKGAKFEGEQIYIVIPSHVLKVVPAFIERVYSRVSPEISNKIQIIGENQVLSLCKEGDLT